MSSPTADEIHSWFHSPEIRLFLEVSGSRMDRQAVATLLIWRACRRCIMDEVFGLGVEDFGISPARLMRGRYRRRSASS